MRYNLSSQIALSTVPDRYLQPKNTLEYSELTQHEKIPTSIYRTVEEGSRAIANDLAKEIRERQSESKTLTLALSGGETPLPIFRELIELHQGKGLSFRNVHVFPLYEFYPVSNSGLGCLAKLRVDLLDHIDIPEENIHPLIPCGEQDADIEVLIKHYLEEINAFGGIDVAIMGVGRLGTLALNLPGSVSTCPARMVILDHTSRYEAVSTFNDLTYVPSGGITLGFSEFSKVRKIVIPAWGENKAAVVKEITENRATDLVPASLLQMHPNTHLVTDLSAASALTRIHHPWKVTSCDWDSKLIRRAIVWLCHMTGKPILKLTNKDYSEYQLGELLARFGSAYNVNIRVFNDIQHTITGWPGGKPNADDSNRPERATPYPKRVLIFSPHPDDDVISMGGTFRRLVEQGHDVHVAYQTSGNIAVGDEEVIRYLSYLRNVGEELGYESDSTLLKHANNLRSYLLNEKEEGSVETPEVRFMKGTIRREEARTACRFVGVPHDHVHFLDLPFYETGRIKKNDLGEADIQIVIDLLREIQPQQIFVAGDLADPHGTHKVCLDAALAAIDVVKNESWFDDCWIWMYRGAWAEWEIEDIEMAVPMSPEQLRFKRNSILKHQSQMESAPFLGDDERLFWQRAEDRNRATAKLYNDLGLASYEAIEAFVRYIPIE